MSLPRLAKSPTYTTIIPFEDNKEIKFNAWTFLDEKKLLIAQESGDEILMMSEMSDVVDRCTVGELGILPKFMIEWLFIKIREKSESEVINLRVPCPDTEGSEKQKVVIDLPKDTTIVVGENYSNEIPFGKTEDGEDLFVKFKFETLEILKELNKYNKEIEELKNGLVDIPDDELESMELKINELEDNQSSRFIYLHTDYIYTKEKRFSLDDVELEEFVDYMNKIPKNLLNKFSSFFNNVPEVECNYSYKCLSCGKTHKNKLVGLKTFLV